MIGVYAFKKSFKKIIQIGIYLLVFLLTWQTRYFLLPKFIKGQFWEYGTYIIYFSELFLLFLVFLGLIYDFWYLKLQINFDLIKSRFNLTSILFFSALFFLYLFISLFWSLDQFLTWIYLIRVIELFFIFWLFYKFKPRLNFVLLAIILSLLIHAGLGLYQFFTQKVFACKYLGLAYQQPSSLGVAVVETKLRRFLRIYAGFPHPNIFAGWLILGIWAIIILHTRLKDILYLNILLLLGFCLFFICLILTFSRSGWIALGLSTVLAFLLVLFKNNFTNNLSRLVFAKFLFLSAILLVILGIVLTEPLTERSNFLFLPFSNQPLSRLENKSISQRQKGVSRAFSLIKKHAFLGVGLGNYTQALKRFWPEISKWEIEPVHNIFLLAWAELGILGLFLLAGLLFVVFRFFTKKNQAQWSLVFISFLLPLFLFDHYLWSLWPGNLLVVLIFCLLFIMI